MDCVATKTKGKMRDFLFRGMDINGIWQYGSLIVSHVNPIEEYFILFSGKEIQVVPKTVGQYTGLKDCMNQYIFESDFIKCEGLTLLVEWNKEEAGFVFKDPSGKEILINPAHYEKISNLHDSPELLKGV